jgi:hypothetical protein
VRDVVLLQTIFLAALVGCVVWLGYLDWVTRADR